jgi:hypothetical protein
MKNVATELYRAVVEVKSRKVSEDALMNVPPDESLDIAFTGHSRHLLRVLADTFVQDESDFAATLLNHALSEALKIMPDVLSDEEFALLENRIIVELGLSAYLTLQPIFPFDQGITYPNYAEVSTKAGVVFGKWNNQKNQIVVDDPFTEKTLYSYPKSTTPDMSIDGMTWQWSGTNVRPLYTQPLSSGNIVEDMGRADVLLIEGVGYFYREEEYLDELKFISYSNTQEESVVGSSFRLAFKVDDLSDGVRIEPIPEAMMMANILESDAWEIGDIHIRAYSMQGVIINPAE